MCTTSGNRQARAPLVVVLAALAVSVIGCASIREGQALQHVAAGDRLLAQDDLQAALKEFEAAAALDPQLAVTHTKMGVIYRRMGDYNRAIDCFAIAVRYNPFSFDDTFALGQLAKSVRRCARVKPHQSYTKNPQSANGRTFLKVS